jgi:hypothetical protein
VFRSALALGVFKAATATRLAVAEQSPQTPAAWRREAGSALEALIEHLRSLGCRDQDIVRLGTQAVSWRGAVYRAVQAP